MPIIFNKEISSHCRIGIWQIEEHKDFFLKKIPISLPSYSSKRMLQHLAGRYLLNELYPDFPYQNITITKHNRPYLTDNSIHFSISHSGNYAAAIIATHNPVGIDIEMFSNKAVRVQHKFLSPEEVILGEKNGNAAKVFTTMWSCKESIYKWYAQPFTSLKENIIIKNIASNISACIKVQNNTVKDLDVSFIHFPDFVLTYLEDRYT